MDRSELVKKLKDLAQMDYDAVNVYDEALEHVKDEKVRTAFEQFRGEHRVHAERLAQWLDTTTGERPVLRVDLMGHVADWVTAFRSVRGTDGALHAMRSAERYHNRRYDEAAGWDVDDENLLQTLRTFDEEEHGHLIWIENALRAPVGG